MKKRTARALSWARGISEGFGRLNLAERINFYLGAFAVAISCLTLYLQFYRRVTEDFRAVVLGLESPDRLTITAKLALVNAGDRQLVIMDQFLSSTLEPGTVQQFTPSMLDQGADPILLLPHEIKIVTVRGQIDTLNMLPRWQPASDTSQTGPGSKQTRIGLGFWVVTSEGTIAQNGKEIATLYTSPDLGRRFVDYGWLPKVIELKPERIETPDSADVPRVTIESLTVTPK